MIRSPPRRLTLLMSGVMFSGSSRYHVPEVSGITAPAATAASYSARVDRLLFSSAYMYRFALIRRFTVSFSGGSGAMPVFPYTLKPATASVALLLSPVSWKLPAAAASNQASWDGWTSSGRVAL